MNYIIRVSASSSNNRINGTFNDNYCIYQEAYAIFIELTSYSLNIYKNTGYKFKFKMVQNPMPIETKLI